MLTRIIRSGLILCLCTLALTATVNAQESISPHKRELIRELITLSLTQLNVDAMIDTMLRQEEEEIPKQVEEHLQENKELTPQEREKMRQELTTRFVRFSKRFRELLPQRINFKQEFDAIIFPLYDKYFNEDDLTQMVAFYKSAVGRKMNETMPQLMPEMMKKLQEVMVPKMQAIAKELVEEDQKNEQKIEKQMEGEVTTVPGN